MKDINVTNLRQNLPEYLAQVEAGETLRVTVHGRAIAEISPPGPYVNEPDVIRSRLRNSLVSFINPLAPAQSTDDWTMNR